MSSFKLFRDDSEEKIEINCSGLVSHKKEVRKIFSISDKIYLLQENDVFVGKLVGDSVDFRNYRESVLDMEFWKHQIYVVTMDWKVLTKDERDDDDEWSEVNFSNDKIVSIKCNSIGNLFVSKSGILYGAGNCGDILNSDYPKRVHQITDKVVDISAGDDFFVILTVDDFPYDDNGSTASLVSVTSTISDKFYRKGYDAIRTKVCSLGARNDGGVLGTGDHVKRSHLNYIKSLEGEGVYKISSGKEHTVARTVDGRIFHWGLNTRNQIENVEAVDFSAPRELLPKRRDIVDFYCKDYQTKFVYSSDFTEPVDYHENAPLVLVSRNYTLYNQPRKIQRNYEKFLISLQNTISECLHGRYFLPPPNCSDLVRELTSEFNKITMIMSTILLDFEEFYFGFKALENISFIEFASEVIDIFEAYCTKYCDCESVAELSDEPLRILARPIQLVDNFLEFLHLSQLTIQMEMFEKCSRKNRLDLELAEHSREFWIKHWKTAPILRFKSPHRRIILDSETVPIKLQSPTKYYNSTHNFILFSDMLVQYGSGLSIFNLLAVWVKIEGECSIKIITPEKTFTLITKSHMEKMLWFNQIESSVRSALGKDKETLGKTRMIVYEYSNKHPTYPKVQAYGRWTLGVLHGSCYLQYPDGKFYFGHIKHGVIEGFGKMMIPSRGLYEGQFMNGNFHGYGIFEMENDRIYDGFFKDGAFNGHGVLRTSSYTYMGDFCNNKKSGYGILDDSEKGDKYMGMFEKGKPNGAGICIKMNGDYFEGHFLNGEISDKGIAYFSESGNYYRGDMKFKGPAGTGQYYVVSKDISEDEVEGNIIVGNLDGTWSDVKAKNANFSIGQRFPKFPRDIGENFSKSINDSRKWKNLFDNFEEQIFGPSKLTDPNEIWNKIVIFMTTEKEKEKYKDHVQSHTACSSTNGGYFSKNISMISNFADLSKQLNPKCRSNETVDNTLSLSGSVSTLNLTSTSSGIVRSSTDTIFEKCEKFENDFSRFYEENSLNNLLNFQFGSSRRTTDSSSSTLNSIEGETNNNISQKLEIVPNFGIHTLQASDLEEIQDYLKNAFRDQNHPLYLLNKRISTCFYTGYGCWKMKPTPILAKQALKEWESISRGVYRIVRMMFPALPETVCFIDNVCVSHVSLLYPILLSDGIYSTLFVLYANKFSDKDENYRQKLIKTEKISDEDLSRLLKFDHSMTKVIEDEYFTDAVNTLKLVKELYCPKEMLNIYERSIKYLTAAFNHSYSDEPVILAADDMMPLTLFLVIRAAVPHLGAELKLLEDLIGDNNFVMEMTGLAGYCYTTITAAYEHITQSSFFQDL